MLGVLLKEMSPKVISWWENHKGVDFADAVCAFRSWRENSFFFLVLIDFSLVISQISKCLLGPWRYAYISLVPQGDFIHRSYLNLTPLKDLIHPLWLPSFLLRMFSVIFRRSDEKLSLFFHLDARQKYLLLWPSLLG